MSKYIGVLSLLFSLCLCDFHLANARESKSEKLAHAKNLQALIYEVDTRIIAGNYKLNAKDIARLEVAFDKVAIKIINKREVEKIRKGIGEIASHKQLRNFRHYLEKMFFVRLSPSQTLSKAEGKKHYKSYCAACHGVSGKGDGPMASRLLPAPSSLVSKQFVQTVTPHMIFNYAVYGIPSGVMKPLGEILNYYDLWNLSYYVVQLAFEDISTDTKELKNITSFEQLSSKDLIELKEEKVYQNEDQKAFLRKVLPFQKSLRRR
jgi:cytochrome c553